MYVIQKQAAFRNFSNVSLIKPNTMLFPLLFLFPDLAACLQVPASTSSFFSSTPKPIFSVQTQPPSSVPLPRGFLIFLPNSTAALPLTTHLPPQ